MISSNIGEPEALQSDVVRTKGKIPDPPPYRLNREYMEKLWSEAERLGALEHLTSKERYSFRQFAVVKAAIDRARSLWGMVRLKGSSMAPPVLRVQSQEDYEWTLYGRLLRQNSPKTYAAILTSLYPLVQDKLRALEAVRDLATRTHTESVLEEQVERGEDADADEAWFREWARNRGGTR